MEACLKYGVEHEDGKKSVASEDIFVLWTIAEYEADPYDLGISNSNCSSGMSNMPV